MNFFGGEKKHPIGANKQKSLNMTQHDPLGAEFLGGRGLKNICVLVREGER